MLRQRALRIDVKRRAEFARERLDGDAFAKQFVADITKIVHFHGNIVNGILNTCAIDLRRKT
jgi:hypothetical protein